MTLRIVARSDRGLPPADSRREEVAQRVDRLGIRVLLPRDGGLVSGRELLAMTATQLRAFGVDYADLWQVLDDAAVPDNEGQTLNLGSEEARVRFAVTDGVDANYNRLAVRTRDASVVFAREVGGLADTSVSEPRGFMAVLRAIGDFFAEIFTLSFYDSWTFNHAVNPADYEARGADLAVRFPASLRALLQSDGGTQALREALEAQRPAQVRAETWRHVVDGVFAGLTQALPAAERSGQFAARVPSLLARDQLTQMWRGAATDEERARVVHLADALAMSGLQAALVERITDTASAPGSEGVDRLLAALGPARPVVRSALVSTFSKARDASERAELLTMVEGVTFRGLSELDQRALLDMWGLGELRSQRAALLDLLASEAWRQTSIETRDAVLAMFRPPVREADFVDAALRILRSEEFGVASPAARTELVAAMANQTSDGLVAMAQALPRLMGLPTASRSYWLGLFAEADKFDAAAAQVFSAQLTGGAAPLSNVLFAGATMREGETGHHVVVLQRYLQVQGYTRHTGVDNEPRFTPGTTAAVRAFQADYGLPETGVVDQATLARLVLEIQRGDDRDPVPFDAPRFVLEGMTLNRPTSATDRHWRRTRSWNDDEIALYQTYADAYMRQRLATGEKIDCADLAYETLVMFARERGLPIRLSNGNVVVTHDSGPTPVAAYVRSYFAARHLPANTIPVAVDSVRRLDIGVMEWDQSLNGVDNAYFHTYNILRIDPVRHEVTVLIWGSLTDDLEPTALAAFNRRHGTDLVNERISESWILDAITQHQGRGVPIEVQRERVLELLKYEGGLSAPSEAQVNEFIQLVHRHVRRDQPTPVSRTFGTSAWRSMVSRDLFSDPRLRDGVRASINAEFSLSLRDADMLRLLEASDDDASRAVAREIGRAAGMDAARQDAFATAVVDRVNGTRQFRRFDFGRFNDER